jgi:hypothetical protein
VANVVYPKYKQRLLDPNGGAGSAVDLNTDTIKVRLVNITSTPYNAAHEFLSDLAGAAIGTDQTLTNPTVTNGVFDADNPTWTAVASGSTVTGYIIYKDTGSAATSNLIAFFDTDASSNPINIATNDGDITLTINASGIFSL